MNILTKNKLCNVIDKIIVVFLAVFLSTLFALMLLVISIALI